MRCFPVAFRLIESLRLFEFKVLEGLVVSFCHQRTPPPKQNTATEALHCFRASSSLACRVGFRA